MNNHERLQNIKDWHGRGLLDASDFDWLINTAEQQQRKIKEYETALGYYADKGFNKAKEVLEDWK